MPFQIIRNDITKVAADAIVNTANPKPIVGRGTDSAIYQAAGEEKLLAERQKIGDIAPGDAAATPAFDLHAKYIIHTVGPVWIDGNHGEVETLRSSYEKALTLADSLSCKSIAFPLIATGVYGFPKDKGLDIALEVIGKFLLTHEMEIILVVFDQEALELSKELVGEIDEFIDEHSIRNLRGREYRVGDMRRHRGEPDEELWKRIAHEAEDALSSPDEIVELSMPMLSAAPSHFYSLESDTADKALDKFLERDEDTFQQRLFHLIDERGLKDPEVYNKANINRKAFSKIRCDVNYKPKKKTAVALGIALELDMPEMEDLLSRAEIAFSPWNKFDLIIEYFITNRIYDIPRINAALFEYDQPLLGY